MFNEPLLEPFFRKIRINAVKKYISENSSVCDLGCGKNATFLNEIGGKIKEGHGLDSEAAISKKRNLSFKKIKMEKNLPLPNGYFDHITLLAVVEHLSFPKEILGECFRCLKGNGSLIMTFPSPKSEKLLVFLAKIGLANKKEIFDHKHYFSTQEMAQILKEIGFKKIEISPFEFGFNNCIVAFKDLQ